MSGFLAAVARGCVRRSRWVLAAWLLLAAVLNVAVPQLEAVAARDSTPFLPASAASLRGFAQMDHAFDSGGVRALTFVVLQDPAGLNDADRAYLSALTPRLTAGTTHVAQVQPLQLSKDGKAATLGVGIRHPLGSPETDADISWLRTTTGHRPKALQAYVTGDAAVYADANTSVARSILTVTVLTTFIIIAILLALYRSWLAPLIPLVTIGVGLGVARGLVALMGQSFLTVSTYTGLFVMALVMGAGTDYSVFLVSRYHEEVQGGTGSDDAVVEASRRIGPVVAASGATVVLGAACLVIAKLALFSTTGPAIAVAVAVTLVAALTFTPALLAWLGPHTRPRTSLTSPRWQRVGDLVARKPAALALTSVVLLGALAAWYPAVHPTYDNRKLVPLSSESQQGYAAFDAHFPAGQLQPDFVLIRADHDLRTSRDLSSLDAVDAALAAVPGVVTVQGVTRPAGTALAAAQLSHLMALVGSSLGDTASKVHAGAGQVDKLGAGASALATGAASLSDGATRAAAAVQAFVDGVTSARSGLTRLSSGTARAGTGEAALQSGAAQLAVGLQTTRDQVGLAVNALDLIHNALANDVLCSTDPVCSQSRTALGSLADGERRQLLPGLAEAAAAAQQIAHGAGDLTVGLDALKDGLAKLDAGLDQLRDGELAFQQHLGQLSAGAAALTAGARRLPAGVGQLHQGTDQLASGLGKASQALTDAAAQSDEAGLSSFWLPPAAVSSKDLAPALAAFLSPDGRTARLIAYGDDHGSHVAAERAAVSAALADTSLAGAEVTSTGPWAGRDDVRTYAQADLALVAVAALTTIFLVLVLLLRSLVAPLFLLATVVLSYAATMAVTNLLWHDLLGRPLDFTVPLLSFIILVAVGADYNILLMSRLREESADTTREGVARAVSATGKVITSAGLIFAGSFVGMITSPVVGLAETGFAVAFGLLLDTFLVRSLLVPSIAALLGPLTWWPSGRPVVAVDPYPLASPVPALVD